jgi:class 3 adenylate cyclase
VISTTSGEAGALRRGLVIARVLWWAVALVVAVLFTLGAETAMRRLQHVCMSAPCDPVAMTVERVRALEAVGLSPAAYVEYLVALEAVLALTYAGAAGLLVWKRANDPLAVFAALTLLTFGTVTFGDVVPTLAETYPFLRIPTYVLHLAGAACFTVFVFVFPDGRFVPSWTRWVALPWVLVQVPNEFISATSDLRTAYVLVASPFFVVGLFSAVFAQVYRYRRVSTSAQRQQTKWTVFGFGISLGGYLILGVLVSLFPDVAANPLASAAVYTGQSFCMMVLPLSIGMAVLRHRLYDIDLIINRTVVYGAVTGILVVAYLSVTTVTQRAVEIVTGDRSGVLPNGAGLAVALAFQPLRQRTKRVVDRVLPPREELALLFTDIVASTEKAAAWGDSQWRIALEHYRAAVRRELRRFGGREVDTAGDGFFVAFSAPHAAVRCAEAIAIETHRLGLPSRLGVHYGGCEVRGEKLSGINVHTAARVMGLAGPDEVLVSESVRDVMQDRAEIHFEDRGAHVLKGVPGEWRLYTVGAQAPDRK